LLTACAVGSQFTRPPEDFVRLGYTTRAQVEARLGTPGDVQNFRQDGLQIRAIQYTYANDAETAKMPNSLCIRSLTYMLIDDVVYGEGFLSACAADHTDFDERKAADIVKGRTRCDEVPQLLGRPSFRAIYPVTKVSGEYVIGYQFTYVKRPLLQLNMYQKDLEVLCDVNGVVREVASSEAGDR
jgi:outer membrane protein assembly factor BamE (lipoprotein component of BamABCDE complex)